MKNKINKIIDKHSKIIIIFVNKSFKENDKMKNLIKIEKNYYKENWKHIKVLILSEKEINDFYSLFPNGIMNSYLKIKNKKPIEILVN